jgi:catechol 2,3-dioxygenase-like lactoylglutathione lyase family enzyme
MIDHVSISVRDLERSATFYEATLAEVGFKKLASRTHTVGFGKKYPELWLNVRPNLAPGQLSDGFHVCVRAASIDQVKAFFRTAITLGGKADGEPGFRPEYSDNYYAAFITDFDGNRIEVVTFTD